MNDPSSTPLSEAEQIVRLQSKLAWAERRIHVLEEILRLQRIKKYGPGSEKLTSAQLELLELEPGVSDVEVQAESRREPLPSPAPKRTARPHPGRQELPAELPRVERVIACAPEQCACPACDKGLVSDRVVIDTVVAKYSDHLPLYRQSAILERETGVEISRATMDGWVMTTRPRPYWQIKQKAPIGRGLRVRRSGNWRRLRKPTCRIARCVAMATSILQSCSAVCFVFCRSTSCSHYGRDRSTRLDRHCKSSLVSPV